MKGKDSFDAAQDGELVEPLSHCWRQHTCLPAGRYVVEWAARYLPAIAWAGRIPPDAVALKR